MTIVFFYALGNELLGLKGKIIAHLSALIHAFDMRLKHKLVNNLQNLIFQQQ